MARNPNKQQCAAYRSNGDRCRRLAIAGGTVCRLHGGDSRKSRAVAELKHEVATWTLGKATEDPGEVMLRLVTQSALRVQQYGAEVARMVAEEPQLRRALVGDAYGEFGKQGEYVRGMVVLEERERDRCANFCRIAIAAGIAERQVRLAERQGALLIELFRVVLADVSLGLTPTQQAKVPHLIRRHLHLVADTGT